MLAYIENRFPENGLLKIRTEYGIMTGKWCENDTPSFKQYDIEIDTDQPVAIKEVSFTSEVHPNIMQNGFTTYITGYVIDVDRFSITLQLNGDIILLETTDNPNFLQYLHRWVCVSVTDLLFYNTNIEFQRT